MKKLVYIKTGLPVRVGDITETFRGQPVKVLGWALPLTPESTGRVTIAGEAGAADFYPSVIDAEWREQ
jgi:hypothetical protein